VDVPADRERGASWRRADSLAPFSATSYRSVQPAVPVHWAAERLEQGVGWPEQEVRAKHHPLFVNVPHWLAVSVEQSTVPEQPYMGNEGSGIVLQGAGQAELTSAYKRQSITPLHGGLPCWQPGTVAQESWMAQSNAAPVQRPHVPFAHDAPGAQSASEAHEVPHAPRTHV
jgi:hypothetical protein